MQEQPNSDKRFSGFVPPTRNYFPMPNMWIDICADIDNLSELKVIQYVLRHTWGWREYDGTPKIITTDEFMFGRKCGGDRRGQRIDKGTGLSNRSVIDGLRRAVEHGYLICVVDDSDKGRITKGYALNMASDDLAVKNLHSDMNNLHNGYEASTQPCEEPSHLPAMKNLHISCEDSSQVAMNNLHSNCEESTQRSEKDTKERNQRNTRKKERGAQPTTESQPPTSLSLSLEKSSSAEEGGVLPTSVGVSKSPDRSGDVHDPGPAVSPLVAPQARFHPQLKPPDSDASPPPVMPNATGRCPLQQLTESQSAFWTRFCAISGQDYNKLNSRAYPHVCLLADRVTTTEAVQGLYDDAYAQLQALAEAKGTPFLPPRLGNLVNTLPDWEAKQAKSQRDQGQEQAAHEHIPGTGHLRNWTQDRLEGRAPERIEYFPLPSTSTRRTRGATANAGKVEFSPELIEQFRQRRLARSAEVKGEG